MDMAGRPEANINWDEVGYMLEAGCTGTEVAASIGIHPNTLYNRVKEEFNCDFSDYLQEKRSKGNQSLKIAQYEAAVKDKDRSMLIWLGKQRLDQKDKTDNVNTHNGGVNIIMKPASYEVK